MGKNGNVWELGLNQELYDILFLLVYLFLMINHMSGLGTKTRYGCADCWIYSTLSQPDTMLKHMGCDSTDRPVALRILRDASNLISYPRTTMGFAMGLGAMDTP